jgi:SOS regulatory protein LexA
MEQDYKTKLITFYESNKRMPSYSEMLRLFGFKSKNAVYRLVEKLLDAGIVAKDSLGRLLPTALFNEIPMIGSVKAGFPAQAEEVRDSVSIESLLINTNKRASTYLFEVDGESMIEAHIADGDMVLVERTNQAKDGDIVIAEIDGEHTMKYLRKQGSKIWLEPANKKFKPMYPTTSLTITGIVKAVIRKY